MDHTMEILENVPAQGFARELVCCFYSPGVPHLVGGGDSSRRNIGVQVYCNLAQGHLGIYAYYTHIWIYLHLHVYNINIYIYVTMCCYICQLVEKFFPGFLWNRCNIFRLLQGGHWCHPTRKVKRDDKKAPATGTPAAAAASFLGKSQPIDIDTLKGNLTYRKRPIYRWFTFLNMVIFHSYVKLPESTYFHCLWDVSFLWT